MTAKLLNHFRLHEGKVLARDALARAVWGLTLDPRSRCIDQAIATLRQHLSDSELIITVHGIGYRYERLKE